MKTQTLSFTAALVVFAAACAFAGIEAASGAYEPQPALRQAHVTRAVVEDVSPDAVNPTLEHLAAYTYGVMESWPAALIPTASVAEVAHDIARASLRKPSTAPYQDAVLLAALAYFEGARFAGYVDRGDCNDKNWRVSGVEPGPHKTRGVFSTYWTSQELMHVGGDCDGGRAHTLWQIWPARDTSSPRYAKCKLDVISGDRSDAAFCALLIARADPSLCGYTGEKPNESCIKADQRVKFAVEAMKKHPFTELPKK